MKDKIKNIAHNLLSNNWGTLSRIDFDYKFKNGLWKRLSRETYNRGDGAAVLLYNPKKATVILTKQFRMPAFINNEKDGMSIEVCAGAIDKNESPETCIIREVEEEVGYKIEHVKKVIECYTSPGAVTEKMVLFVSEYDEAMKVHAGGGLDTEDEEIEVLEVFFTDALQMIYNLEIIDAKTIILLQYLEIHKLLS